MIDFNSIIILVSILAAFVFILLVIGYYFLFLRKQESPAWKKEIEKKLRETNSKTMDKKLLLIELDKLLELALKKRFNEKKSLGEILKAHKEKFLKDALDDIWSAHKLRNKLVHDVDIDPKPSEINGSIIILKRAIKNIIS
jgi:hypothetical protein